MLPNNPVDLTDNSFIVIEEPIYTYRMDFEKKRIYGHISDGLESVKQAVHKIMLTERFIYVIYSWNYGIQTRDLFGMRMLYVQSEFKRRAKEALMRDSRVTDVIDFKFEKTVDSLHVTFTVVSIYGKFNEQMDVTING